MKNLLAPCNVGQLQEMLHKDPLLAFDFDGTLAPIVDDPAAAELRPTTRRLLHKLAARLPCIVISGRARIDAMSRLTGIPLLEVFGNHGVEPWFTSGAQIERVAEARRQLTQALAGLTGALLEDKTYSLSVHFRHAHQPEAVQQTVADVASRVGGLRLLPGKAVCNLIPLEGALITKASALAAAQRFYRHPLALYVGDDVTDEDVFAGSESVDLAVIGVRVGRSRSSQASYFIRDQLAIDELLGSILSTYSACNG